MTELETKELFGIMQSVYPSSELFQGDVEIRVKIWAGFFKAYDLRTMKEALARYVSKNKFAPAISDMMDELKADVVASINTADEWEQILSLCETLNDYRCEFGYSIIPPGAKLSQGAQAREDAERVYNAAPHFIREYLGSYHAALQYAYELQNLDSTGMSIRRRDYEQRRKEAIADSTVKELEDSLLTDGLTKRVVGYTPQYMPIYEEDGQ